jgi:hypothetical protein
MCPRLLLFLCFASERRREEHVWSGEVGREHPPRCSPRCPLRLLLLNLLLRVSVAPTICGMGVFSFHQPTVAARWGGRYIPFLGALLVQVTASAPQASGRMLAVGPDVATLLAVVALGKSILGSRCLHPDSNVAEARQTESFLGLCCPRHSYEEQKQVYDFGFLGS